MQFGLSESVAHWGRYRRDRRAVLSNGAPISYGRFNEDIDRLLPQLLQERASRIAVACGSKYKLLVAILATLRAGKSVVLLNGALGDEALRTNLKDAEVAALLHDSSSVRLPGLVQTCSGHLINMSASTGTASSTPPPVCGPTDEWGVLFSSGTTGIPKGIERDHGSMVTEFIGWIMELGLNRQSTFFIGRPIYYTGGLVLAAATLLVGGTIIVDDLQDENNYAETWSSLGAALARTAVDWAFFVPDQLRAFIKDHRSLDPLQAPTNILTMGGPIAGSEKQAIAARLHCNVIESWGNSESLGTITEADDLTGRPNSIGRPFVGDDMFVVDESLQPVPAGEQGRIAGGEEAGFRRYSNRPDATGEVRRQGLIISEDLGYQDKEGYFYILGRLSDNVVRCGKSVFLSQIEACVRTDELVRECCVTAVGDETRVEVVALVTPTVQIAAEELRGRLNAHLSTDQRLDRLLVMDIPKLPSSGKIDRLQCKMIAAEELGG